MQGLRHGSDSWSLSELTHAITLLAHFHSLSTLVLACGITCTADCSSSSNSSSGHESTDDAAHQQTLAVSHFSVSVCLLVCLSENGTLVVFSRAMSYKENCTEMAMCGLWKMCDLKLDAVH